MAHIYGKVGESAFQKSIEKRWKAVVSVIVVLMIALTFLGFLEGLLISRSGAMRWLPMVGLVCTVIVTYVWMRQYEKILDEKLRVAHMWHRGYEGERVVGELLEDGLSDKYHVFNDVKFPGRKSNIDHIVVGPSGVFVLNTKNWRGIVAWSDDGETLLWNGVPEKKGTTKAILADALDVHDKLKTLTNHDFFVRSILVFPLAKVMPKLNTKVELQQEDYLIDKRLNYIDKRYALPDADVKVAVRALNALFRNNLG